MIGAIDTHAHLEGKEVIERSFKKGVLKIINISRKANWSDEYENVYLAVGYHPYETDKFNLTELKRLASLKKVVAIGECGLDIKRDNFFKQKEVFQAQLNLAKDLDLPVSIHCREMHSQCLELLLRGARGVVHCFSGSWNTAQRYLEKGLYLSFTGLITYTDDFNKVLRNLPLEKILLETDCPFLAPVPYRGQASEPWMIKFTAEKIAEVREVPLEEIIEKTNKNAEELFDI